MLLGVLCQSGRGLEINIGNTLVALMFRLKFQPLNSGSLILLGRTYDLMQVSGGGGGIRTHDELAPIPVFETGAFDHSATPPLGKVAGLCEARRLA